jgi:hypothetical protein
MSLRDTDREPGNAPAAFPGSRLAAAYHDRIVVSTAYRTWVDCVVNFRKLQ